VLLPTDEVAAYLDKALAALTLHTEARTSFITYWLPCMVIHEFIAFTFLPQSAYDAAARLEVTPIPDAVVRVFMLFKGLSKAQAEQWRSKQRSESLEPWRWVDIVGIDTEKARDQARFRVLEWGGMELT